MEEHMDTATTPSNEATSCEEKKQPMKFPLGAVISGIVVAILSMFVYFEIVSGAPTEIYGQKMYTLAIFFLAGLIGLMEFIQAKGSFWKRLKNTAVSFLYLLVIGAIGSGLAMLVLYLQAMFLL